MDYIIFFGISIILLVIVFLGTVTARVVGGIGLMVLGMLALSGNVTATYFFNDNGTVSNVTYNLLGNEKFLVIPIAYVFGGIAVLVSVGGVNLRGGGSGGFTFAD
ncbi:hypothetical protein DRP05_13100 [Archaeoglobales archaeon]|nr:MAG: hypothetical protein DRP05_13100 [Archaeoglobales archaeon]